MAAQAAALRLNLKLTTLRTTSPLLMVGPGTSQAERFFTLLESLEMKSSLAEARKRYSGQQELF